MMVGRLIFFWDGLFSGAMLNFQGVHLFFQDHFNLPVHFISLITLLVLFIAKVDVMRVSLAAVRWALGASVCKLSDAARYWQCWSVFFQHIFIRFLDRPCHALKIWINFLLCMYVLYILYISYISLSPMSLDSRLYIPVGEVTEAPKKKVPDVQLAKGATEEGAKRWIFWVIRCCDVGWFWVMLLWLLWVILFSKCLSYTRFRSDYVAIWREQISNQMDFVLGKRPGR